MIAVLQHVQGREVKMLDLHNKEERCSICGKEYTSIHTEAMPGVEIYVCKDCLEAAKDNFIWICMSCGKVYMRAKEAVLKRMHDPELKRAYELCENMQIIQGIDMCVACDPESVVEYVNAAKMEKFAGSC